MSEGEYLLICLAEECAEISEQASRVAIRASKMLRFGATDIDPKQLKTAVECLTRELADLLGVAETLEECGVITLGEIQHKKDKIKTFMSYSQNCGVLERKLDQ